MVSQGDSDGKEDHAHNHSKDGYEVYEVFYLQLQRCSWGRGRMLKRRREKGWRVTVREHVVGEGGG